MTKTPSGSPETDEPLILEKLGDLQYPSDFLAHYPDIRGRPVINPLGDEVGIVDDLYVNPRNRQVEMAAITFTAAVGFGGKRVLVPVEELQIARDKVKILTQAEKISVAPEFREGAPSYEPYYEYWSTQLVGPTEEAGETLVRPPGRLELEDEETEEEYQTK